MFAAPRPFDGSVKLPGDAQIGKGGKAEQLANRVRNRVLEAAIPGLADRGIKVKNLCVLRETDAPAVLVENAFISNFDDRKNILTNSSVLQTLAYCYAQAILDILNIKVNLLETVTIEKYPVIRQIKQVMRDFGSLGAMMSGSGPTVFGIFEEETKAKVALDEIRKRELAKQLYITRPYNL